MKLNCDLGERDDDVLNELDELAMSMIDLANIACGFHASSPEVMVKTIKSALLHKVTIGAHPSYQDKVNFGRSSIVHSPNEITHLVAYQTGALQALCKCHGAQVEYIKPHGALYNDMMADHKIYIAILQAAVACMEIPTVMILAKPDNTQYQQLAEQYKVKLLFEAFADRAYTDQGTLVSRSIAGSVFYDGEQIINQFQQLNLKGSITSINGKALTLTADNICVHGDNDAAIAVLQQLRDKIK